MKEVRSYQTPSVILDRYEDFEEYAKQAALVIYRPDIYRGPFLDDPGRVRRVTFTAVGVRVNDIVMNFTFALSYEDISDSAQTWEEQSKVLEQRVADMVATLSEDCDIVQGSLSTKSSLGEALSARL
ncbi:MAG: hypothetical protein ACFFEF_02615 [Candidatus Thorarchaeota archaeon]